MWIIAGLIIVCALWFVWMATHAEYGYEDPVTGYHSGMPK
jgi:hypothetical protein